MYSRTGSKNTGICTTGAVPSQSHDTDVAHLKPWAPSNTLEPRPPPAETGNHHAATWRLWLCTHNFETIPMRGTCAVVMEGESGSGGGNSQRVLKRKHPRFFKKKPQSFRKIYIISEISGFFKKCISP